MDTATHMVLGAACGELVSGKKAGNKALLWGAVIGAIPDLDIIPGQFMDTITRMDFHRGFSHSLVFAMVLAPVAGWLIEKIHKKENINRLTWVKVTFLALLSHILLDCFTTWGTQVFWPLEYRVAWNTIYVIDPLYSVPLAVLIFIVFFIPQENSRRRHLTYIALTVTLGYLLLTVVNKQIANRHFEASLNSQNINYSRFISRPTPFNSILWTATAETSDGFCEGYYSLLDSGDQIKFKYHDKNQQYLRPFADNSDLKKLFRLTRGLYNVQLKNGIIAINDLRYGQMHGWMEDGGPFVFEYLIKPVSGSSSLQIIRNRINRIPEGRIIRSFFERIKGN